MFKYVINISKFKNSQNSLQHQIQIQIQIFKFNRLFGINTNIYINIQISNNILD